MEQRRKIRKSAVKCSSLKQQQTKIRYRNYNGNLHKNFPWISSIVIFLPQPPIVQPAAACFRNNFLFHFSSCNKFNTFSFCERIRNFSFFFYHTGAISICNLFMRTNYKKNIEKEISSVGRPMVHVCLAF